MNNKTNQGILPFQMIKIAAGSWESLGPQSAPKVQSVNKINADGSRTPGMLVGDKFVPGRHGDLGVFEPAQAKQKGQGTLDLFATGNGYRNADGELGKTPIEAARTNKSKKRGFLSTLLSSTGNFIKKHPVAVDTTLGVSSAAAATPALLNLFGDDDNSSKSSETPKSEPKSQPAAESKSEPTEEPKATETPAPTPSKSAPTNGTGTPAGETAGTENKDFIDRSIQSINEFKAKHPELFWSGVGLAGLGSVYALAKALDDDDDDDDYYYYRHR